RAALVAERLNRTEQRLSEIERRQRELRELRDAGELTQGEFAARMAETGARAETVKREANRSAAVARDLPDPVRRAQGLDGERLDAVRERANGASGPEVSAIARGVAGNGVGQPLASNRRGPPAGAPGAGNGTGNATGPGAGGPSDGDGASGNGSGPMRNASEPVPGADAASGEDGNRMPGNDAAPSGGSGDGAETNASTGDGGTNDASDGTGTNASTGGDATDRGTDGAGPNESSPGGEAGPRDDAGDRGSGSGSAAASAVAQVETLTDRLTGSWADGTDALRRAVSGIDG
ncbi:hypothetical protein, partial [Halorubrum kocurii]